MVLLIDTAWEPQISEEEEKDDDDNNNNNNNNRNIEVYIILYE